MLYYYSQGRTTTLDPRPFDTDLIVWNSPWGMVLVKAHMPYLIKVNNARDHLAFRVIGGRGRPYVLPLPKLGIPIDSEYDSHHHRHMMLFSRYNRSYFTYSDDSWITYKQRRVYSQGEPLRFAGPRTLVTPKNSVARRRNIPHSIQPIYLDGQVGRPFLLNEKEHGKYVHRLSVNFDGKEQFVLNTEADQEGKLNLTMHLNSWKGMHCDSQLWWCHAYDPLESYGVQHDGVWYATKVEAANNMVLHAHRRDGVETYPLK